MIWILQFPALTEMGISTDDWALEKTELTKNYILSRIQTAYLVEFTILLHVLQPDQSFELSRYLYQDLMWLQKNRPYGGMNLCQQPCLIGCFTVLLSFHCNPLRKIFCQENKNINQKLLMNINIMLISLLDLNLILFDLKMGILSAIYMAICGITSIASAYFGHSNVITGDKDILLPFSAMIFVFYSLLIYLPQAHFKTIKFQLRNIDDPKKSAEQEEDLFPISMLLTLLSIICTIGVHAVYKKYYKKFSFTEQANLVNQNQNRNVAHSSSQSLQETESQADKGILKYILSLALGLQNTSIAYFISAGPKIFRQFAQENIGSQIFIFGIFSLLINFAYGYILSWSGVNKKLILYLSGFTNSGLAFGFIFGLFLPESLPILFLPCLSCGIFIYTSNFIGLPNIFSNGEKPVQDKFRYGSIVTSLLLSIVYYPFCYLLRV